MVVVACDSRGGCARHRDARQKKTKLGVGRLLTTRNHTAIDIICWLLDANTKQVSLVYLCKFLYSICLITVELHCFDTLSPCLACPVEATL